MERQSDISLHFSLTFPPTRSLSPSQTLRLLSVTELHQVFICNY